MCLKIKTPSRVTDEVYKVYVLNKTNINGSYDLKAAYKSTVYPGIRIGTVIESDRISKKVTALEKKQGINLGLHVFTRYEDAATLAKARSQYNDVIVLRLTGERRNRVAVGVWDSDDNPDGAVYTKLAVSKFIEVHSVKMVRHEQVYLRKTI